MTKSDLVKPITKSAPPSTIIRNCTIVVCLFVVFLLIRRLAAYLYISWLVIKFPFQIDYGEGIVWQQALMLFGDRAYGNITTYPFIVFHYPPIYHLFLDFLIAIGSPALIAGRSISLASAIAIGLSACAITYSALHSISGRRVASIGAIATFLVVLTPFPLEAWSTVMRVDMLAIAFSFAGIACALSSISRPVYIYIASLLFVLAIYTKQTALIAPLASLPVMYVVMPRHTIWSAGVAFAAAVVALAALMWKTSGRFLEHVVLYNVNRLNPAAVIYSGWPAPLHIVYFGCACVGIYVGFSRLRVAIGGLTLMSIKGSLRSDDFARALIMVTLYMLGTTFSLVSLFKSGSWFNYLVEWMCVWSIPIGMLVGWSLSNLLEIKDFDRAGAGRAALLMLLISLQIMVLPKPWSPAILDASHLVALRRLQTMVRMAPKPVLSDDMVLLMNAGKQVPWEPAIFSELARAGRWDEALIIDRIRAGAFSFIITGGGPGDFFYDSRFNPAVSAAIEESYPRIHRKAGYLVHERSDQ